MGLNKLKFQEVVTLSLDVCHCSFMVQMDSHLEIRAAIIEELLKNVGCNSKRKVLEEELESLRVVGKFPYQRFWTYFVMYLNPVVRCILMIIDP